MTTLPSRSARGFLFYLQKLSTFWVGENVCNRKHPSALQPWLHIELSPLCGKSLSISTKRDVSTNHPNDPTSRGSAESDCDVLATWNYTRDVLVVVVYACDKDNRRVGVVGVLPNESNWRSATHLPAETQTEVHRPQSGMGATPECSILICLDM